MNGEGSQFHIVSFPQQFFQFRSPAFQWQTPQISFSKTKGFLESSHSLFPEVWEVARRCPKSLCSPWTFRTPPHEEAAKQGQLFAFPFRCLVLALCCQNCNCFGKLKIYKLRYAFNQYSNQYLRSSSRVPGQALGM